jgi:hypothetical protein
MRFIPIEPFAPVPDRITQTAWGPRASGQRAEKNVDRRPAFLQGGIRRNFDTTISHREVLVRRNDINMVRLDVHFLQNLSDGKRADGLQHLRKTAVVLGREMQDDDIGDPTVGRHLFEKCGQGLYASGRGA